jgi:hypothetical protein
MNTDTDFGRTTLIAAAPRAGRPAGIISASRPCTSAATTRAGCFITTRAKRNEQGNTQRIKHMGG